MGIRCRVSLDPSASTAALRMSASLFRVLTVVLEQFAVVHLPSTKWFLDASLENMSMWLVPSCSGWMATKVSHPT